MENIKELKKNLRKSINKLHHEVSSDDLAEFSQIASEKIIKDCKEYITADTVYAFVSFGKEIDTSHIIKDALARGKRLLLPRVTKEGMVFKEVADLNNLIRSDYGILEPAGTLPDIWEDGFMLVPGVVFGRDLYRIGHGAGYYDKFLAETEKNIFKAGFCYNFQIIDKVPAEEHDIRIDAIYSNGETII